MVFDDLLFIFIIKNLGIDKNNAIEIVKINSKYLKKKIKLKILKNLL